MRVLLGGALEAQSAPNEAFGLKNVQAVALQQAKPMPQDKIADLEIYLCFSVYCWTDQETGKSGNAAILCENCCNAQE